MPNSLGILRRNTLDPQTAQELDRLIPRLKSYVQQNTRVDDLADYVPWTDASLNEIRNHPGFGVASWTVPDNPLNMLRWRVEAHTMTLKLYLLNAVISSIGSAFLSLAIPGGYRAARFDNQFILAHNESGPNWVPGGLISTTDATSAKLSLYRVPHFSTFDAGVVSFAASVSFEVL